MTRVHFVTLSRSDYSTLRPVALAASKDPGLETKVIAGGSHLLERFGRTMASILAEGYPKVEAVDFLREKDDGDAEMAAAYSRAVEGFTGALAKDIPDLLFIVGDRWEMMAVATAAAMLRIPIAHHSGGDITQGSADNQTRYVLTTLSHLHFTALEEHAERLIRMGEEPWRVVVTGEPALTGLDSLAEVTPGFWKSLGLAQDEPFALATFHPTSHDDRSLAEQADIFIKALGLVDGSIVLTAPNPDPGSGSFFNLLSEYARKHPRIRLFTNLGPGRYYAAMSRAQLMIGNSSSGLWEAPSFGLPVVNIGRRQAGRIRGRNVIDASLDLEAIRTAIADATRPGFRETLQERVNPYVRKDTVERILAGLKRNVPREKLLAKIFIDPLKAS